jgi:hypothetical protein
MRVLAVFLILAASTPAIAADSGRGSQMHERLGKAHAPLAGPNAQCPRTTAYLADQTGLYRGAPLTPRKLTELPPATAYMAVYRHIGDCEAPLTMVDYRNPRRR